MNRRETIQALTAALAAVGLPNCSAAIVEPKQDEILILKVPNGLNRSLAQDIERAIAGCGIVGPVMILPEGFSLEKLSHKQLDEFETAIAKLKVSR